MMNTCPFKVGDAAVFTKPDGGTRSVKVVAVRETDVVVAWHINPRNTMSAQVLREDWGKLVKFPTGALFFAV